MSARIFNQGSLAEMIVKDAKVLAESVIPKRDSDKDPTRSQIRNFYQEYVTIRQGIPQGNQEAYKKKEVAIKMLIAKAEYAAGRKNAKINAVFKNWLVNNIKAINGPDDVHKFGDYFEAFVGYFYGITGESGSNQGQQNAGGNRGR